MDIKTLIKDEALRIGIDVIGFTSCLPFEEAEKVLKDREAKGYLSGFEEKDIKKRTNPSMVMEGCETIISAGISYNVDEFAVREKDNLKHKMHISRSSWGLDYHKVLMAKLNELSEFINHEFKGRTQVFVDTGPLVEREVARRAGIGYIGKNCSLINPKYGAYIFLGEILTDIYIEPDNPIEDGCGDCDLCLKACPTKALCSPYTINAKGCVSYLTQCRDIPYLHHKSMGCSIYGCDICHRVCPKNKGAHLSRHSEFVPEDWNYSPDAAQILKMSNRDFENTFKNASCGWRGKKILQRNVIIALGNSGNKDASEYIIEMLSDSRRDIRETSVYALYNLLGDESSSYLKEHLLKEKDPGIIDIIRKLTDKA